MNICLIGPGGVGKTTLANKIKEHFPTITIINSDILREYAITSPKDRKIILALMERSEPVPKKMVKHALSLKLQQKQTKDNYIFDNVFAYEFLPVIMKQMKFDFWFLLETDETILLERSTTRKRDDFCMENFNKRMNLYKK